MKLKTARQGSSKPSAGRSRSFQPTTLIGLGLAWGLVLWVGTARTEAMFCTLGGDGMGCGNPQPTPPDPKYSHQTVGLKRGFSPRASWGAGTPGPNWNTPVELALVPEPASVTTPPALPTANGPRPNDLQPYPTLALSPNTIGNNFSGFVDVAITGLNVGETVRVEKFHVNNAQGTVDAAAIMEQSFLLTDGVAAQIAGRINLNVPGDLTPADGAIGARLSFVAYGATHIVGNYVYRLTSPSSRFDPVIATFTVTNVPVAQAFSGQVLAGAAPVPYAAVALVDFSGGNALFVAGTFADAAGHYSLGAAPGSYNVIAVKPGYVFARGACAACAATPLGAGTQPTLDLQLMAATQTISGQVVGSDNPAVGLPGVQLYLQSAEGLVTVGYTDANGNFSVPVGPGQWVLGTPIDSLNQLGYLASTKQVTADTRVGSVANLSLTATRGDGLIVGYISDPNGTPLPAVEVLCNTLDDDTSAYSITDTNGYFTVAVSAGTRWLDATSRSLVPKGYLGCMSDNVIVHSGQAMAVNLAVSPLMASAAGVLRNALAEGQPGVMVQYQGPAGSYNMTATRVDGAFTLGVSAGDCEIFTMVTPEYGDYYGAYVDFTAPSSGSVSGLAMTALPSDRALEILVTDNLGTPIPDLDIMAACSDDDIQGTYSEGFTDSTGTAWLDSFDGEWDIAFDPADLAALGLSLPASMPVTTNGTQVTIVVVMQRVAPTLVPATIYAGTPQDQTLNLSVKKLLVQFASAFRGELSVSGVSAASTNGGVVTLSATTLAYTPPAGYFGNDSFTYTLSDTTSGASADGTVVVLVLPPNATSGNLLPPQIAAGAVVVQFLGLPGRAYTVQRQTLPNGAWTVLGSVLAGPNGLGSYTDTNPPAAGALYRTVYP